MADFLKKHFRCCNSKNRLITIGCRNSGVYGNNCTMMCPVNCKEGQCDINSGHCLSCVLGYRGPTCNTSM